MWSPHPSQFVSCVETKHFHITILSSNVERNRLLQGMTAVEKILVLIDRSYLGALYRIVIGFALIPTLSLVGLDVRSPWTLTLGLLTVLISLRIFPALIRKLLPLSAAVNAIWFERRQIAKRYDSYQWQKLFFVGVGLASYILASRAFVISRIFVAGICVILGAVGLARWYGHKSTVRGSVVHKYSI